MMTPLPEEERSWLWRSPAFLPGLAQHWKDERDEPVPIRAKRTEPTRPTIHAGLYRYVWEPDPHTHPVLQGMINEFAGKELIVQRCFVFHDEDYSDTGFGIRDRLDSHKGDSECFITVYDNDKPILLLTRNHYIFWMYERPELIGGRLWVEIEHGGHGQSGIRAVEFPEHICGKQVRLYIMGHNLDIRDMESEEFKRYEPAYKALFAEWGIDWPANMGDRRIQNSKWYRGDSVYAWDDPMEFAYRLKRCTGKGNS